ncbi:zf-TFIIB domain-containing protein [Vulgatibacter sp.]|uniref:zf-TFIIB domain-containing protein n=1 Tax=Vulgatibacter sp. TaxID=1971226 RepID=UPI003567B9B9
MDCPRCTVEMNLLEGEDISLQRCADCGGVWIDPADLNPILLRATLPVLDRIGGKMNLEEVAQSCSECQVEMTVVEGNDKSGLRYEACEGCGGIWLEVEGREDAEDLPRVEEALVNHFREFKG